MQKPYTLQELSESPLNECVRKTAETNKITIKQVQETLTQKPVITVFMSNAKFEIEFTDDDRQIIYDIVKKNNKKGNVSFKYIEDLFTGKFNNELRRGGTQISFTMGTFSDAAKKSAYAKAKQIAKFWNEKAAKQKELNHAFIYISNFFEYEWFQIKPSHDLYGWMLDYRMV